MRTHPEENLCMRGATAIGAAAVDVWSPKASPVHEMPLGGGCLFLKQAGGLGVRVGIVEGADRRVFNRGGEGKGAAYTEYQDHILEFLAR